jgi:MraZ protein
VSNWELIGGHALATVDAKGRVALPLDFRTAIQANAGQRSVFIARHDSDPCLTGYDKSWQNEFHDRLDAREEALTAAGEPIDYNIKRRFMGGGLAVTFDEAGRFILPDYHRDRANIGGLAFFYGWGRTFDIWDPQTLIGAAHADAVMRDICEYEMSRKGRK